MHTMGAVRLFARLFRVVWGGEADRALRPVLAVSMAGSIAGSLIFSFLGIWAIKELGASQSALGTVFLIGALLAAGSGYLGGHLSDHVGRRPLMLAGWGFQSLLGLGFLAVGHHLAAGLALLSCVGLFASIGGAAATAMVADLVPPERHEAAYASVRVASNLGVTMGPPLGGFLLLAGDWPALFVGASSVAASGFLLAWRFIPRRGAYAPAEPPQRGSLGVIRRDRPFVLFLVSAVLAWLVYVAFEAVLPISLVSSHGLAPATWGFLVIINPALVTLCQLRLTRLVAGVPAPVKLLAAMPLMGMPFLLLSASSALPVVALVILLFVIGEMLWVPTSQSVTAGLAPEDLRGAYMGAFGSTAAFGFALAPFVGLQVRAAAGDGAMWTMFAAISLAGAVTGAGAAQRARRPAPEGPATAAA